MVPQVSVLTALGAGLISFFSPCILPLLPSYLSFITGVSSENVEQKTHRRLLNWATVLSAACFVLGFSLVFVGMGVSASLLGGLFGDYKIWIARIGGIFVILFGLHFLGITPVRFFQRERRVHLARRPAGYVGAMLIGIAFSAGWTPCVSYALSPILIMASNSSSAVAGGMLLAVYSLGLGVPFLLAALAVNTVLASLRKIRHYMRFITLLSGAFLLIMGVWLATDQFRLLRQAWHILVSVSST